MNSLISLIANPNALKYLSLYCAYVYNKKIGSLIFQE